MAAIISIHSFTHSFILSFGRCGLARKFICGNSVLLNYIARSLARSLARSSSVRFIPSVQFSIDFGIDIVTRGRDGDGNGLAAERSGGQTARLTALQPPFSSFALVRPSVRSFGSVLAPDGSCCIQGFPQSKHRAEIGYTAHISRMEVGVGGKGRDLVAPFVSGRALHQGVILTYTD